MDAAGATLFGELLHGWPDPDRQTLGALLDRFSRQLDEPTAARRPAASPDPGERPTGGPMMCP
jgi:hypothetical protein